jgi:hypothetical protein
MVIITKFSAPDLVDNPSRSVYLGWRQLLQAQIGSIPGYAVRYIAAMAAVPPVPVVYAVGVAGADMQASQNCLFAAVMSVMNGTMLQHVANNNPLNLVDLVTLLNGEYARTAAIENNAEVAEFYHGRFNPKTEQIQNWINAKHGIMLKNPTAFPVAIHEPMMIMVLTTNLPPEFDEVANRCRTEQGLLWRTCRDRLTDFDKCNPKRKREQNEQAMAAKVEVVRLEVNDQMDALHAEVDAIGIKKSAPVKKTLNKEAGLWAGAKFTGTCNYCKKVGHKEDDCYAKQNANGGLKKGSKHHQNGGKKGKGKVRGKKGKKGSRGGGKK